MEPMNRRAEEHKVRGGATRRMRAWPKFAATLSMLALVALGTARLARGRADQRHSGVIDAEEVPSASAETQRQIQELRGELALLQLKAAIPVEPKSGEPSADKGGGAGAEGDISNEAHAKEPPPPDPEGDFRLEPVDSVWAETASARVSSALERANVTAKARSTECRGRTCRIEIVDDPMGQVFSQINPLLAVDFPTGTSIRTIGADGKSVTTFYFRRQETP
jgi:hypothetical protein